MYQPFQQYQYPQQIPQPVQPAPQIQPQMQPQMQNSGFMLAPSEEYVNSYAVAPGNCITFKIEGKPLILEKSKGFSQLEAPRIDRYRLIKEEQPEPVDNANNPTVNDRLVEMENKIASMWSEIEGLKNVKKPTTKRNGDD